jgi:hypothetical protein
MEPLHDQKKANRFLEGDTFYPTGHIIIGLADGETAEQARKSLMDGGVVEDHVTVIPAEEMAREARENLKGVSLLSVGASIPTREKQLQLAEQGVHFLMVYAPEDEDEERVLQRLAGREVRYAVKYRRLVIENLMNRLGSTSDEQEPARVS